MVVEVAEEEVAEEVEEGVQEVVNPKNASTHQSQAAATKRAAPSSILLVRTTPDQERVVLSRMADQD